MEILLLLLLGLGGGDDGLLPLDLLASSLLTIIRDLLSAPPSACHDGSCQRLELIDSSCKF